MRAAPPIQLPEQAGFVSTWFAVFLENNAAGASTLLDPQIIHELKQQGLTRSGFRRRRTQSWISNARLPIRLIEVVYFNPRIGKLLVNQGIVSEQGGSCGGYGPTGRRRRSGDAVGGHGARYARVYSCDK